VNAGERAARERVETVYAAVDRLGPQELSFTVMPPPDLEERTVLLADLEREADRFGRGALLDEARAWLRDALRQRIGSRAFHAETGVAGLASIGRPEDIASVALALEDAVSVAVTEDLLDPADAAALADPGRRLLGLPPLEGASVAPEPEPGPWEPTPADWAAADDDGEEAVDHEEPMSGSRGMQARVFGAIGVAGVLLAVVAGVATGEWGLAALAAIAVAGIAGTFATYRRPITRP
jgi:hypothetical protein